MPGGGHQPVVRPAAAERARGSRRGRPGRRREYTWTVHVDLEEHRTHTVDALFYSTRTASSPTTRPRWRRPSGWSRPPSRSRWRCWRGRSARTTGSWDRVSQAGTDQTRVLAYLARENVHASRTSTASPSGCRTAAFFGEGDRTVEGPPHVQPDPLVVRPVPQRARGREGVPGPQRPARGAGRRAARHPAPGRQTRWTGTRTSTWNTSRW